MPDDTQDAKAQKLAAARKKLKEYQQRNNNSSATGIDEHVTTTSTSTASIASNLSERSESELILNGVEQQPQQLTSGEATPTTSALPTAAAFFGAYTEPQPESVSVSSQNGDHNLHAIQVLIAEKAQLTTELTKSRHTCRERELELEELRTELTSKSQRLEQLQQHCQGQQQGGEQQRQQNAELQHKLAQALAQSEDQRTHLAELEAQLQLLNGRVQELTQQHADKSNELDMAQLRVRQLSDESHINADNRVETLTQTQYMYEQQIRDLQAMVAQLTQDKEQASTQYQNYVQHQSGEIAKLNEQNVELGEDCAQLRERERQLVEHVSGLERDIQKNLSLQAQFKEAATSEELAVAAVDNAELVKLRERLSDFDFERHEFQLKIKSQDDQLLQWQQQLLAKDEALSELEEQLGMLRTEQPDQAKLLASMESDKVAASRALSQNVEMKQQLDELELRFVQLTNDKAELVNQRDAEEFANREMRQSYAAMQQKLEANEQRFKFKDEEMIRLSHENVELARRELVLQQQLDRLQHYEAKAYRGQGAEEEQKEYPHTQNANESEESADVATEAIEGHDHKHDHKYDHDHKHDHDHEHVHKHDHGHKHDHDHDHSHDHSHSHDHRDRLQLPTTEAVEKLQSRFTTLISQVADLTEEKQSLEHLVLQLQSETETIGEYIALYQTQRRMLKQREYEKATQMRLLQAEREQMREKIDMLNQLVASLGVEQHQQLRDRLEEAKATSQIEPAEPTPPHDSQQILHKIQDIITEIKENTEQLASTPPHAVDHLNCCLGKFEVV